MLFLIEANNQELNTEVFLWRELIRDSHGIHTSIDCDINSLSDVIARHQPEPMIPLGTLPFTHRFFEVAHGIPQVNPVEIPPCLRTPRLLCREYAIVTHDKIPKTGEYFVKDASCFKAMSYCGDVSALDIDALPKDHLYVVSEKVDVLAEYRVYVIDGEVYAVQYYNGDPLRFPDARIIAEANEIYSCEKDYPRSYTIDVMVTPRGTLLTEIHPVLFACGLYTTVLGSGFLDGYIDGYRYVLRHNTPVQPSAASFEKNITETT